VGFVFQIKISGKHQLRKEKPEKKVRRVWFCFKKISGKNQLHKEKLEKGTARVARV
jgi:hypothetical protein